MGQLFIWSAVRGEWISCPPDEITWLDRGLLSENEDLMLHRAPRCAGLRYVHHRWELFSRDPSYRVYVAPQPTGRIPAGAEAVQRAARHVLPVAPGQYEPRPGGLEGGGRGRGGAARGPAPAVSPPVPRLCSGRLVTSCRWPRCSTSRCR